MSAPDARSAARGRFWRWVQSLWATLDVLLDRELRADLRAIDEEEDEFVRSMDANPPGWRDV